MDSRQACVRPLMYGLGGSERNARRHPAHVNCVFSSSSGQPRGACGVERNMQRQRMRNEVTVSPANHPALIINPRSGGRKQSDSLWRKSCLRDRTPAVPTR